MLCRKAESRSCSFCVGEEFRMSDVRIIGMIKILSFTALVIAIMLGGFTSASATTFRSTGYKSSFSKSGVISKSQAKKNVRKAKSSSSAISKDMILVGFQIIEAGHGQWFVNGLAPDSPAYKAGIRPGDEIVAINGREVRHITRDEEKTVQESITFAKKGTEIRLHIARINAGEKDITILVEEFQIPTERTLDTSVSLVTSELRGTVGILRVSLWKPKETTKAFREELKKLIAQKPRVLVLDIRRPQQNSIEPAQVIHQNGEILSAFVPIGTMYGDSNVEPTQVSPSVLQFTGGNSKSYTKFYTSLTPVLQINQIPSIVLFYEADYYRTQKLAFLLRDKAWFKTLMEVEPLPTGVSRATVFNPDVFEGKPGTAGDPPLEEAIRRVMK
jgi:membrane-associated protease RseP (regulator of RpoE activity)